MSQLAPDAVVSSRPRLTRSQVVAFSTVSWIVVFGLVPLRIARHGRRLGWRRGRPSVFNQLGVVILGLGASGLTWCLAAHYKPGETVAVSLIPEKLIASGPYRYSRNPMYLSEAALLLGWTAYFGSPGLAGLSGVVAGAMRYFVMREETTLRNRFGESWEVYAASVPRWL
jgi:protein-S-isoprenylcysteine O-methyltransferase Ste14